MSHTVTITALPNEDTDDYKYSISGTHDGSCEAFHECWKGWHRHPQNDYGQYGYDEWSTKRVPQVHYYMDGSWCVPQPQGCGFDYSFEYQSIDEMLPENPGLGTYAVEVHWDDNFWSTLNRISAPTEQENRP
jgi:hypothetical protein